MDWAPFRNRYKQPCNPESRLLAPTAHRRARTPPANTCVFVLTKGMSVVGPRAITFEELEWFGDDVAALLSVRPGVTGLWQTGPRNVATFQSGARQDLEMCA